MKRKLTLYLLPCSHRSTWMQRRDSSPWPMSSQITRTCTRSTAPRDESSTWWSAILICVSSSRNFFSNSSTRNAIRRQHHPSTFQTSHRQLREKIKQKTKKKKKRGNSPYTKTNKRDALEAIRNLPRQDGKTKIRLEMKFFFLLLLLGFATLTSSSVTFYFGIVSSHDRAVLWYYCSLPSSCSFFLFLFIRFFFCLLSVCLYFMVLSFQIPYIFIYWKGKQRGVR